MTKVLVTGGAGMLGSKVLTLPMAKAKGVLGSSRGLAA
jgi:nucleoside-diphosphate-sugar epimerase